MDRMVATIKERFGQMRFLEVGVFGGGTVTGIVERCKTVGCPVFAAGVDFDQWMPRPAPVDSYEFYEGDSMDAWRKIPPGRTFNFLFVDGCHCVNHAQADFLNYSQFVEPGGFCVFHDTALPDGKERQDQWPQNHGYAGKPDSYLGVRKALENLGLLKNLRKDWKLVEEIPSNTGLMGMCLFEKASLEMGGG